jgi:hypothetical protein
MANRVTTPVKIAALACFGMFRLGLAQFNTLVPQVTGMKTENGIRLVSQESVNPFALEITGKDIRPQSPERLVWLIDGKRVELRVAARPSGLRQASDLEFLQAYKKSEMESLKPSGWTQMGADQQSAFPAGETCLFFTAGKSNLERLEYAATVNGDHLVILVASVTDPQLAPTNHEYLQRTLLSLQRGTLGSRNLAPPPDSRQFGGTLGEMIGVNERFTGRHYGALVNQKLVTPVDSRLESTYRLDPVSLLEAAIFLLQTGKTFFSVVVFDGQRAHAINLDGYDETTKQVKYWDPRGQGSFLATGSNGAAIAAAPHPNEARRWLVNSDDLERVLYAIVLEAGDVAALLRNFNQSVQAAPDQRASFRHSARSGGRR